MVKLTRWLVTERPKQVLWGIALVMVVSLLSLTRLQNDPNPEILPLSHESRVSLRALQKDFTGARDIIVVMLDSDASVFRGPTLARVRELSQAFRGIAVLTEVDRVFLKGLARESAEPVRGELNALLSRSEPASAVDTVDSVLEDARESLSPEQTKALQLVRSHLRPIIKIHSLADTDNIVSSPEGVDVRPIFEGIPQTDAESARIEKEVVANDLFRHLLVGTTHQKTGIFLETSLEVEDSAATNALYDGLKAAIARIPGPERVYIAGTPVTTANIASTIDRDMGKLFPIVFVLILICLWVSFRMVRGVVLPVLVVVGSIISTLAIQAAFDIPLNVISATLPVFILCIGVAEGIHLFAEYRTFYLAGLEKKEAVSRAIDELFTAVLLTSITNAAGFLALAWTEIVQIAHFGIFVGLGTVLSLGFTLLFIPALLMVMPAPKESTGGLSERIGSYFDRVVAAFLEVAHRVATRHVALVLVVSAVMAAFAAWGTSRVQVDNNRVKFFAADSDVSRSAQAIMTGLAGTELLNLVVSARSQTPEPMKDPAVLAAIDGLEKHLRKNPLVGQTTSIAGLTRRINLVMNAEDPAFDRIPEVQERVVGSGGKVHEVDGKELISQYLLLYENGGGDMLRDFVDFEYSRANVRVDLRTNSSNDVRTVMSDAQTYVAEHFPKTLDVKYTGTGVVLISAGDEIIMGELNSFGSSFLVVLAMLIVPFRSLGKSLLGMVPLLFATLINFGIMGALGVSLDIGTAIVSSVAIGVGVDYSIHYLSRLSQELQTTPDLARAMANTVQHAGPAIVYNAFTVGVGFLALLASSFTPIVTIGWMVSLTMFTTCVSTLMLTPALLLAVKPRFVRVEPELGAPAVSAT